MKHTIKKICGLVGLVLVAAVTVIAYNMPANPVSATSATTDTIQVIVRESGTAEIVSPIDDGKTVKPVIHVTTNFADSTLLSHYISYTDPISGETIRELIDTFVPYDEVAVNSQRDTVVYAKALVPSLNEIVSYTDAPVADAANTQLTDKTSNTTLAINTTAANNVALLAGVTILDSSSRIDSCDPVTRSCSGTYEFSFSVNELYGNPSYDEYTLEAVSDASSDFSVFTYTPAIPEITGYTSDSDPIISYTVDENVSYIKVQAVGADGRALFDGDGLTVDVPAGQTSFSQYLPFYGYNAKNQTYTIYFSAYNVNGNQLYKSLAIVFAYNHESPTPAPATPDTGSIFFGNLNFSDSDYVITGVLVFLVVAVFATILVLRRQRRR